MGHKEHPKAWPSVTQVLAVVDKPFLKMWYGKNGISHCERIKKESAELGQRVHDAIAESLQGREWSHIVQSGTEAEMVGEFEKWAQKTGFKALVVEPEKGIESATYEYSGTFDAIGTFGDSNDQYVCDWKTTGQMDDMHGCQLAAYAHAYTETTGFPIKGGLIVRLEKKADKKKRIEVKEYTDLPRYFTVFLACKRIWDFLNKKF